MDPDPAIFVIDLQDANKKLILKKFFCLLHHFSKIKRPKKLQNSRNQGFSYYFCLMIEGSGRPKNMWIRIRNTACLIRFRQRYGSGIFMWIPEPKYVYHPGFRVRKILDTYVCVSMNLSKKVFTSSRNNNLGCSSRIRIFPIRIQGSKKHRIPDPDQQHWILDQVWKKPGFFF